MKINGKRNNEAQKTNDKRDVDKSKGADEKRSFKELLEKDKDDESKRTRQGDKSAGSQKDSHDATRSGRDRAAGEGLASKKGPGSEKGLTDKDGLSRKDGLSQKEGQLQKEGAEFQRASARAEGDKSGFGGGGGSEKFDDISPEDERALMKGAVPGVSPAPDGDVAAVKAAQPLAPSQTKHEVTEKLLATIVSEGYVAEDVKGRKVVMMQVDIPGRGTVNMRLWRRSSGVELRMRADDPQLASEIRRNRGQLESGARERGINFSSIEVVG